MTDAPKPASRKRIAIIGSPRAGKTTLATQMSAALELPVVSSDDYISETWSGASDVVADLIERYPGIYEGVAVVRALRKLLERDAELAPVDEVILLRRPLVPLTAGQETMRRGCHTILREIWPDLLRRGVKVVDGISA
jgi:hypothetical protein